MSKMYLSGTKIVKLDAKARLTLPADFRKEFDTKVRLIPMPDALYGFTPDGFAEWMEGIFTSEFKEKNPNHVAIRRVMNGRTVMLDIDSAGRIALSKLDPESREKLGIEGEVVVNGMGDRFEVWNKQAWDAANASVTDEDLAAVMQSLDF